MANVQTLMLVGRGGNRVGQVDARQSRRLPLLHCSYSIAARQWSFFSRFTGAFVIGIKHSETQRCHNDCLLFLIMMELSNEQRGNQGMERVQPFGMQGFVYGSAPVEGLSGQCTRFALTITAVWHAQSPFQCKTPH